MLFEVTFMQIDVAEIDVFLADETAAAIEPHLAAKDEDARESGIADAILAAPELAVRMRFRRDTDLDRLLKGMRRNLEGATKDGFIDAAYLESLWTKIAADFQTLATRGVQKGDALTQRVGPNGVETMYSDAGGTALVHVERPGPEAAASVKGAYFGQSSRFRSKLIRSLESVK